MGAAFELIFGDDNVLMRWTGHDTIQMALHYASADFRDSLEGVGVLESYLGKGGETVGHKAAS